MEGKRLKTSLESHQRQSEPSDFTHRSLNIPTTSLRYHKITVRVSERDLGHFSPLRDSRIAGCTSGPAEVVHEKSTPGCIFRGRNVALRRPCGVLFRGRSEFAIREDGFGGVAAPAPVLFASWLGR